MVIIAENDEPILNVLMLIYVVVLTIYEVCISLEYDLNATLTESILYCVKRIISHGIYITVPYDVGNFSTNGNQTPIHSFFVPLTTKLTQLLNVG